MREVLAWLLAAVLIVAAAVTGALSQPLLAGLALGAAILLGLLYVWPVPAVWTLGFLTAAFPKAGIKVGEFPFPVFLFGLVIAVTVLLWRSNVPLFRSAAGPAFLFFAAWCLGRLGIMAVTGINVTSMATFAAWSLVTAGFLLAVPVGPDNSTARGFGSAIDRGFMVAAVFGLVQYAGGLEATQIPGLTIAWGDSYAGKNLVVWNGLHIYTKIPSTYQGGNLYGVVAAFFLTCAVLRVVTRQARRQDWLLLPLAAIAVTLSGSRTALLAAAVGVSAIFLMRAGSGLRKLLIVAVAAVAFQLAVLLQPGLTSRYTITDLILSGGAGRTEAWSALWARTPWWHWLIGVDSQPGWEPSEGGAGFLQTVGVVGALLFLWLAVSALRRRPEWLAPFAAVGVSIAIDSAYQLFPTLFLPAARAIAPLATRGPESGQGRDGDVEGRRVVGGHLREARS